jgi:peptidoglycan hydrolase-like protein with peptidoglycan-binding domain
LLGVATKKKSSSGGKKGAAKSRSSGTRKTGKAKSAARKTQARKTGAVKKKAAKKPAARGKAGAGRRAKTKVEITRSSDAAQGQGLADELNQLPAFVTRSAEASGPSRSSGPMFSGDEDGTGDDPGQDSLIIYSAKETPSKAAEGPARPKRLVPTNAVHVTERRHSRRHAYTRSFLVLGTAALIGLFILSDRAEAPDVTAFEQASPYPADERIASVAEAPSLEVSASAGTLGDSPGDRFAVPSAGPGEAESMVEDQKFASIVIPLENATVAIAMPSRQLGEAPEEVTIEVLDDETDGLNSGEITEMERLLTRMDMGTTQADGILDGQTTSAIRLYQEYAGLPVNGRPSQELLTDMREVVKLLDGDG